MSEKPEQRSIAFRSRSTWFKFFNYTVVGEEYPRIYESCRIGLSLELQIGRPHSWVSVVTHRNDRVVTEKYRNVDFNK